MFFKIYNMKISICINYTKQAPIISHMWQAKSTNIPYNIQVTILKHIIQ